MEKDIPIYVLIEHSVYAEFQTYKKNRDNGDIHYAHVDSINIFRFIEEILAQPRNNPVHAFDKYSEIEEWLRSQWAGLYRELLNRRSSQQQIASLAAQVAGLAQINETLRRYLEEVMEKVSPQEAAEIIKEEKERLASADMLVRLRAEPITGYLAKFRIPTETVASALKSANTADDVVPTLLKHARIEAQISPLYSRFLRTKLPALIHDPNSGWLHSLNEARSILNLPPFPPIERDTETVAPKRAARTNKTSANSRVTAQSHE